MEQGQLNWIANFIWGIADDVLRDLFRRGKYPDVILPMCVIRRMDAVLEPTKQKVLDTKKMLDEARITEQRAALCDAADQAFYNTSKFTLRDLKSRGSQQQLLADFEDYLNGFSPNVQDILDNFKFRNQLQTLSKADAIGTLINKFLDPDIDLSPAGIDNHSMGTVFEELVRRFNEENNEEAGEHWTPRDAVRLMANLVFLPIEAEIKSGTYLLYDCACGTGGMLTVAERPSLPSATSAASRSSVYSTARRSTPRPTRSARRTGDMERIIEAHLLTARQLLARSDTQAALAEAETGLLHAVACGYGLLRIELLVALARIRLAWPDPPKAIQAAREALDLATAPDCQYAWGEADAAQVWGEAYLANHEPALAHRAFTQALAVRKRIEHPGVAETEKWLAMTAA